MTMLDIAMSIAGRSLEPQARGGVTVEMKTSFLQPGNAGSRLIATGRAFHRSTTMSFCEGEIRDDADRLIAKSIGTFKTVKGRLQPERTAPSSLPDDGGGSDGG